MKQLKKIPKFKNEEQERKFWSENDSTDYIDFSSGANVDFPNLKPSTKTISLRLPEPLMNRLKVIAHKKDVPYQSLIKMYLSKMVEAEINK